LARISNTKSRHPDFSILSPPNPDEHPLSHLPKLAGLDPIARKGRNLPCRHRKWLQYGFKFIVEFSKESAITQKKSTAFASLLSNAKPNARTTSGCSSLRYLAHNQIKNVADTLSDRRKKCKRRKGRKTELTSKEDLLVSEVLGQDKGSSCKQPDLPVTLDSAAIKIEEV
jgi:hypothetical protein